MKLSAKSILEALKKVIEPDLGKDIVSLGLVSELKFSKNNISFSLQMKNVPRCMLKKNGRSLFICNRKTIW